MAATLTKAMLNDLETGNAIVKIIPQTNTITDTSFNDANTLYTADGTLTITQAQPTKTEIKVDQMDAAVAVVYEAGEFTVSGTLPTTAIEAFEYFYSKSTNQPTLTTGITANDGVTKLTEATGFNLDGKRVNVTMYIESKSGKTAIVFTNVVMIVNINWGTVKTTPFGLEFTGTVLSATAEGVPSFIVLKA